jgi:hypothetical protein
MFSWWRATPVSTVGNIVADRSTQSLQDVVDPRRWRMNPLNILAGIMNAREEQAAGGNYHSSSRHGAHNTTGNARARLNGAMTNQYGGGLVNAAATQGRFNSESWERFSWNRAKSLFEQSAAGFAVHWHPSRAAALAASGLPGAPAPASVTFYLDIAGGDVGISMTAGAADRAVSGVRVAINYFTNGAHYYAWNGQMFPSALPVGVAGVAGPAANVAALHNTVRTVTYNWYSLW